MKNIWNTFIGETSPVADPGAIVAGDKYRFSVITSRLIRMEYREDGHFIDRPSQKVICRNFPLPDFRVRKHGEMLEIITSDLHLFHNGGKFCHEGLYVKVFGREWHYGQEPRDMYGTARTLDGVDGATVLEHGIMSKEGYSLLDDSDSALIDEDGWIIQREGEGIDLYFFGYGHDYPGCLKDFYCLCGPTPLLPRFSLGNWWSRYYQYTQDSYLELMKQFKEHDIPLSVAVIDMDWHLVDIPEKYGTGWTGYTWNRDFFPHPEEFLTKLHEMGLHTTLNVHPSEGVGAHEEAYISMAEALNFDTSDEDSIPFSVTDPDFMNAYFEILHHPMEKEGVDFWWIDWQQGTHSALAGVDPLWMLNHLHFLDSKKDGKRGLILSRFAGTGSHRYPIGFSGDTVNSWQTLDFQPYFTANASNVGYSWWSHDIGGHMKGQRDDELSVRWVQFGVFSPIMRLHSTSNIFYGKEPWNYNMQAEAIMSDFMRLRHKLIPYLYTMNFHTHLDGIPLIMPMYYRHDTQEAYQVPNEYYFGDEMIVCPITRPIERETMLGSFDAWIPEGTYFDFFSGMIYKGGKRLRLFRPLEQLPVLVPAGSVIPLARDYAKSHLENPSCLDIYVYNGADGKFTMYEDDCSNDTDPYICKTAFTFCYAQGGKDAVFTMEIQGDPDGIIPKGRTYVIHFTGMTQPENILVESENTIKWDSSCDENKKSVIITLDGQNIRSYRITLKYEMNVPAQPDRIKYIYDLLMRAQISYQLKEQIFNLVRDCDNTQRLLGELECLRLSDSLLGALCEVLTADC